MARAASPRPRRPPRARVAAILEGLAREYPRATCALVHRDPWELLVATILSAQCTDVRVNQVTPVLFSRFPDPAALARARPAEVERIVRSTGFFRNKTRALLSSARAIVRRFGGQVPRTMEDLLSLRGVARKTANVVLGTAFGIADGVVVDTHVSRIARRLGLTRESDPRRIERDLAAVLPREEWIDFSHRLIWHGRRVCKARKPLCASCALGPVCPSCAPEA